MKWIYTILIFSLGISCTPERRLSRLIKNHPELVSRDTVWKNDTVRTELVKKDSSFYFYQRDTVLIKQGNLEIRYFTRQDSTVYIQGKCLPQTIVTRRPYIVNTVNPIAFKSVLDYILQWLPIVALIGLFYFLYRKRGS